MKYPDDHYAPVGIQQTRCVIALSVAALCMKLAHGIPTEAVTGIKTGIAICTKDTKTKRLSGGAKRDINNCQIVVSGYMETLLAARWEARRRLWAALLWCALTFMEDAVHTCPYFTDGVASRRWAKLLSRMEELAEKLRAEMPGTDEVGTYLYEKSAWALDGVPFRDDSRESLLAAWEEK